MGGSHPLGNRLVEPRSHRGRGAEDTLIADVAGAFGVRRHQWNMSQQLIADEFGMSQPAVSKLMKKYPAPDMAGQLTTIGADGKAYTRTIDELAHQGQAVAVRRCRYDCDAEPASTAQGHPTGPR